MMPMSAHRWFPRAEVGLVRVVGIAADVVAPGHGAHAHDRLAVTVPVGVVEGERVFGDGGPDAAERVELVHVEDAVAVGVGLEFVAPLVARDLADCAVVVEVVAEPGPVEPAVVEIAEVELVPEVVPVVVDVVDHAVDRAVGVVIDDVAVGVLVTALSALPSPSSSMIQTMASSSRSLLTMPDVQNFSRRTSIRSFASPSAGTTKLSPTFRALARAHQGWAEKGTIVPSVFRAV